MLGNSQVSRRLTVGLLTSVGLLMAACGSSNNTVGITTTTQGATAHASTVPAMAPTTTTAPPTTTTAAPVVPTVIQIGPGPLPKYSDQPQPASGSCHYTYVGSDPLPDPNCTPGAVNPQVTQGNIGSTICQSGYTSSIRPPEGVTGEEKVASAAAYG